MKNILITASVAMSLSTAAQTMRMKATEIITKEVSQLGESAMWDYRSQKLLSIDIEGKAFMHYDPSTGLTKRFGLEKRPGTIILTSDVNTVLLALEDQFALANLHDGTMLTHPGPGFGDAPVRFNDGKCDARGRLWVGTVDCKDYANPIASLYRLDAVNRITKIRDGVTVSNGIAWSLDGSLMYYIDSPTRSVLEYKVDAVTGDISNPRVAIKTPADLGTPDGSTIDAEGMLWVAQWGGACVCRWNPRTGEMLARIDVPALNVTSVAFGGQHLDTLFITTAQIAMQPGDESRFPLAGHTFVCTPGVKGINAYIFKQ